VSGGQITLNLAVSALPKGGAHHPFLAGAFVMSLLHVNGVTLRYKIPSALVTATDRASFQVELSDRFVLLGPSGDDRGVRSASSDRASPLALIWFGLGSGSLVFVLIHSMLWAVALNTHSGFMGLSQTLSMVGRNYGPKGLSYVFNILVPAAFPSILTGLKIGWAFAWRTLIAAELVFGVSSGQGGLGGFIFEDRNLLGIPAVSAGLLTVIIIGLVVENLIFRTVERKTIRKWGLQT
jgi:hypothetical protein